MSSSPRDTTQLSNEPQLLEELAQGDKNAFTDLYRHYSGRVFDAAILYIKDPEEAKEIVQIIFIRLWEKREKLSSVISFKDYLFILSRNEIYSYFRKKASMQKNTGKLILMEPTDTEDTDYRVRESQYKEVIQKGIDLLAPQQKKVYILSRQREMSIEEIALELQLSPNTVRNHLSLALRFMRAYLNENQHACVALPLLFVILQ